MKNADERRYYITEFRRRIIVAAANSLLSKRPCDASVGGVAGARACVLFIDTRIHNGEVMRALKRDEFALLRSLVPFELPERESMDVYMQSQHVRVEIAWPSFLSILKIKLSDICDKPHGEGMWVAGMDESGKTTICQLNDQTPHFLIAGQTGSGKSVAIQNAVYQLGRDPLNEIVLIDGKWGESLKALELFSIAPCAVNLDDTKAALSYVIERMEARYSREEQADGRLVVIFDEFQEFTEDKLVAELMRKIASLGRGVKVHLIASTQHPLCDVLGDPQTRRNLPGRIALQVEDRTASKVVIGNTSPRADLLTGIGDSYVIAGGFRRRIQGSYVDTRDWKDCAPREKKIDRWDSMAIVLDTSRSNFRQYTAEEVANALKTRTVGGGRPMFREMFDRPPGGDRSRKLLVLADNVLSMIN